MSLLSFENRIKARVGELRDAGLLRTPKTLANGAGRWVSVGAKTCLSFSSNNYLGLAQSREIADAIAEGAHAHGAGAGASRLVSGTSAMHRQAEDGFAEFMQSEAALLFSSGYAANVGTLQAVPEAGDAIFSDELNHASIIDGCRLSRANTFIFKHLNLDHLEHALATHRPSARDAYVVTESVFSMDGDMAPLTGLRELCDRYDASLIVDEAHGVGVFGPQGRGLAAELGVKAEITVAALGKAFGLSGAMCLGSEALIRLLTNRARSYVFSTAPSPSLAAGLCAAIPLVAGADEQRARVLSHSQRLRSALRDVGIRVGDDRSPIVPLLVGGADETMKLSATLLDEGFFVQGIRPPTVPTGTGRLRIVPTAEHAETDLDALVAAIQRAQA